MTRANRERIAEALGVLLAVILTPFLAVLGIALFVAVIALGFLCGVWVVDRVHSLAMHGAQAAGLWMPPYKPCSRPYDEWNEAWVVCLPEPRLDPLSAPPDAVCIGHDCWPRKLVLSLPRMKVPGHEDKADPKAECLGPRGDALLCPGGKSRLGSL